MTTEVGVAWGEKPRTKKTTYIRVRRLPAGKFHRYASWHLKDYFIHFDITVKELILGNIIGFLGFILGLFTSFCRLVGKDSRPDVIFLKGGFVSLPVGIIARLLKIPYIIHESDVTPGLANRLLMKKAQKVAFGMPLDEATLKSHPNYIFTGIPVGPEFKSVSPSKQTSLKKAFSFNPDKPLVVITGGSQGSENLNNATRAILPELLKFTSVGLTAGRKHYESMVDLKKYENWKEASLESNFRMWEFNTTMNELLGAADVIVSRAGATTIAEMAALKKAVILVPFAALPGAHQQKNADRLAELDAVTVIKDIDMVNNPSELLKAIRHLVKSPRARTDMAEKLHHEAKSDAASILAEIILEEARRSTIGGN